LGKKQIIGEEEIKDLVLPVANDVLCIAVKLLGFNRVLVSPWDFQSDKQGDIIWRYKRNQAEWLRKKGYLTIS